MNALVSAMLIGFAGFMGIFTSRYVFMCAAFATMGGMLFGYDQGVVSITLVMPQFLNDFPEVSPTASGAGFLKGLMTAMIELGAFLGETIDLFPYLHRLTVFQAL